MAAEVDRAHVRLAELVAALSLGVDLGFGQPMEHVLRQCLIALRLAERIGLDEDRRAVVYYTALLVNVGCHTDAHEQAKWFGEDLARDRRGKQFDPVLAELICADGDLILSGLDDVDTWQAVVAAEPALAVVLSGERFDAALAAIAKFIDLKSPYFLGHSAAVAELVAEAGRELGLPEDEV